MSERAQALAERFERTNREFIETLQQCTEEQWRAKCANDDRTVAVVAGHVAGAYTATSGWVQAVASGQPLPPLTHALIDQINAQHAERHPEPDKAETIEQARRNGEAAASMVRGLSDQQLDRAGSTPLFGPDPVTAEQLIVGALIGHARGHLRSIQATLASQPT
jgi:DinB superfamily